MQNSPLEHRLRQRIGQHAVPVDTDALWDRLEPQLPPEPDERRRIPLWSWLLLGLLAVAGLFYLLPAEEGPLSDATTAPASPTEEPIAADSEEEDCLPVATAVTASLASVPAAAGLTSPKPKFTLPAPPPARSTRLRPTNVAPLATTTPARLPRAESTLPTMEYPTVQNQLAVTPAALPAPVSRPRTVAVRPLDEAALRRIAYRTPDLRPALRTAPPAAVTPSAPAPVAAPTPADRRAEAERRVAATQRLLAKEEKQATAARIKAAREAERAAEVAAREQARRDREAERQAALLAREQQKEAEAAAAAARLVGKEQAKEDRKVAAAAAKAERAAADLRADREVLAARARKAAAKEQRRADEAAARIEARLIAKESREAEKLAAARAKAEAQQKAERVREINSTAKVRTKEQRREEVQRAKAERKAYYAELKKQATQEWERQVAESRARRTEDANFYRTAAKENQEALKRQKAQGRVQRAKDQLARTLARQEKERTRAARKQAPARSTADKNSRRAERRRLARARRAEREARRAARRAERDARRAKKGKKPKKIRKKKEKFYTAEVYAGVNLSTRSGTGAGGNEQQLEGRTYGGLVGYHRASGVSVRSGVLGTTIYSKLESVTTEAGFRSELGVVSITEAADGTRTERRGMVQIPTETTTTMRIYNRRSSVDIPLLIGYRTDAGPFGLLLEAGPLFNLSSGGTGSIVGEQGAIIPASGRAYFLGRRAGVGALLNAGASYGLGEKSFLTLNLRYQMLGGQFENAEVTPAATTYGTLGVQVGYRVRF